MTKDEALKRALEALGSLKSNPSIPVWSGSVDAAIDAIKQALTQPVDPYSELIDVHLAHSAKRARLAQPEPVQEPVAWIDSVMEQAQVFASAWSLVGGRFDFGGGIEDAEQAKAELRAMLTTQPAAQQAPVQPVALPCCGYTDAGAVKWNPFNGVVQCHNCGQTYTPPTQPAPVQEPVAYPEGDIVGHCVCGSWPGGKCLKCPRTTQPAQCEWIGLTDEEVDALWEQMKDAMCLDHKTWWREIEAKLKKKNT